MSRPIRTLLGLAAAGLLAATSVNIAAAAVQPDTSTQRIRSTRQVLMLPGGQIVVRMVDRTAESFRAIPTDGSSVGSGVLGGYETRLRQPGGEVPEIYEPAVLLPGLAGLDEQPRQTVLERRLPTFTGFTGASVPNPPGILLVTDWGDGTKARLTWSDDFINETGYRIERQTSVAGVWGPSRYFQSSADIVDVVDNPGSGTHRYRVAVDAWGGSSRFGDWVTLTITDPNSPPQPPEDPDPPVGGAPATPTGLMAASAGNGRVLLSWTDNADNEVGFRIERNPAMPEGASQVSANVVNYLDTPGPGAFQYRVRAEGTEGESPYTPWVSVLVPQLPPEAPSNPFVVSQGNGSAVLFTWNDNSNNEAGFLAVRESFDGLNWGSAETFAVAADAVSMTDTPGLGQHRYRVRAANSAGASEFTPWAQVTVSDVAPAAPTTLAASDMGDGSRVQLVWSDRSTNELAFDIDREQFSGGQWGSRVSMETLANRESFIDAPGLGQWRYRVRARNDIGASVWTAWTEVTVAMIAPAAPSNLVAQDAGNGSQVSLSWQDQSNNESAFELARETKFGASWISPVTVTLAANATTRTDSPGVGTFRYRIRSKNSAGASAFTGWTQVTVATPAPQPPAAPSGINAVDAGSRRASITWVDNSSDETAFELERQPSFAQGSVLVAAGVTGYVDQSGPGTFNYRVRATSAAGASAWTGYATVTVQETPPAAPSNLTVADAGNENDARLTWTDNAFNETAFKIERQSQVGAAWGDTELLAASTDSETFVDSPGAGTHRYRLAATNAAGDSSWTAWATVVITSGWTQFTPSADTRIVYVSSSEGNDANDGLSEATPKRTIAAAENLVRTGYPDWILLKSGDTFVDFFSNGKGGRSVIEPMVFSNYGDGPRPIIAPPVSNSAMSIGRSGPGNVAVVGLHLKASELGTASSGIAILCGGSPTANYLIEDCIIDGFKDNLNIQGGINGPNPIENVTIRRSTIRNAWSTAGHSQGAYINSVHGLTISECIIDRNGWHQPDRSDATIFNHNLYIATKNENVVVRNCLISRASSHGLQLRSGGDILDNVFIQNPISIQLGGGDPNAASHTNGVAGRVIGNVVLESNSINATMPRAQGIYIMNIGLGGGDVLDNIVANAADPTSSNLGALFVFGSGYGSGVGYNKVRIADNVFYNAGFASLRRAADSPPTPSTFNSVRGNVFEGNTIHVFDRPNGAQDAVHTDFAVQPSEITFRGNRYWTARAGSQQFRYSNLYQTFAAWQSSTGDTGSVFSESNFSNPDRSLSTYLTTLGESGGLDEFVDMHLARQRQTWPSELAPVALVNYIRAGFDKAAR